ncbi:MAG: GMP synthase (glutamine-hydrolyzing), partial [Candidatus Latescibacteria bacterium]|nr:GMP synthase (glutamine-hydrolyzing) [bacterium]MBD3423569.1 GMP synthase (glutamine-hydrolyzing) [Candidatus Latescibacterota bacterium]
MNSDWDGESIVILDFGSQYTQLIGRRVRGEGVFSVILPHHAGEDEILENKPCGIILSGGPANVDDEDSPGLEA